MSSQPMHFTLVLAVALVLSVGCKKKDIDSISEAQDCLDSSTSSTALACMEKVNGLDSEAANLIRCSANFIYQEFTSPTRLAGIAEQMKNSGGASPAAAMGLLAFGKPSATAAGPLAADTLVYCQKAKSKGMLLLAAMAQIATSASVALNNTTLIDDCNPNSGSYNSATCEATAKAAICGASSATIGQAALAAYQQSCLGSSQQNSTVCAQFAAATSGTTDAATIGTNVKGANGCP